MGYVQRFSESPFRFVRDKLSGCNVVVNLEAPFVPGSFTGFPVKNKISLKQDNNTIKHLKFLNPYLVNLSNNHINDYGNQGAENTMSVLRESGLSFFGAGFEQEDHNLFTVHEEKLLFLSYTTRSADLSNSRMFNGEDFIGPKEYSPGLLGRQINGFTDYLKIVLFHWGIEDIPYPLPEQRRIAREVIEAGVDLIIGNHPHVIQSYEKYKGRWIFYCLGHFFFPDHESHYLDRNGNPAVSWDIHSKQRKVSIVPVFNTSARTISLESVLTVRANRNFEPSFTDERISHNLFLCKNLRLYSFFYKTRKTMEFLARIPGRIIRKAGRMLSG